MGKNQSLIQRLSNTKQANKLFIEWYNKNNWKFVIPINELLQEKYRAYQQTTFIEFFNACNIGLLVLPSGFISYVVNSDLLPEELNNDFILDYEEKDMIVIENVRLEPPQHIRSIPETLVYWATSEAIYHTMFVIQNFGTFNKNQI